MSNTRIQKSPGRELVGAMMLCAVAALLMFGSSAWAYLHRNDLAINRESVPIAKYNSLLDLTLFLTTHMTLYLGVAFFCIGYLVLKAHRKYRLAKQDE